MFNIRTLFYIGSHPSFMDAYNQCSWFLLCEILQDSTLSPLLFNIYMKLLSEVIHLFRVQYCIINMLRTERWPCWRYARSVVRMTKCEKYIKFTTEKILSAYWAEVVLTFLLWIVAPALPPDLELRTFIHLGCTHRWKIWDHLEIIASAKRAGGLFATGFSPQLYVVCQFFCIRSSFRWLPQG